MPSPPSSILSVFGVLDLSSSTGTTVSTENSDSTCSANESAETLNFDALLAIAEEYERNERAALDQYRTQRLTPKFAFSCRLDGVAAASARLRASCSAPALSTAYAVHAMDSPKPTVRAREETGYRLLHQVAEAEAEGIPLAITPYSFLPAATAAQAIVHAEPLLPPHPRPANTSSSQALSAVVFRPEAGQSWDVSSYTGSSSSQVPTQFPELGYVEKAAQIQECLATLRHLGFHTVLTPIPPPLPYEQPPTQAIKHVIPLIGYGASPAQAGNYELATVTEKVRVEFAAKRARPDDDYEDPSRKKSCE